MNDRTTAPANSDGDITQPSRRQVLKYGLLGAGGLILGPALAACGSSGSESSAGAPTTGAASASAGGGGGTAGGGGGSKVVLRFPSWQWGQPGYDEFFTQAMAAFTKDHPNVTFQKIPIASASFATEMVKMYVANDPPEINQFLTQLYYQAASAGWYESLDDMVSKTDIPANWSPFLDKAAKFNGHRYGIWISGSSQALMYNKKMLDAAGLQAPTTPEELLDHAKKLTKGSSQYGYSITTKMDVNGYIYGLANLIAGLGGSWVKDGKLDATNPANKKAIEFEDSLIKAGVTPVGLDRIAARQAFYEGKSAMMIEGPWVMTTAASENPSIIPDLAVSKIPFPNQVAGTSNGFAMAKNQKHADEAWQFIQFIMSKPWQQKYGEMTGVAPARQGCLTAAALKTSPWLTTFNDIQNVGKSYISQGFETLENQIDTLVAQDVTNVYFGHETVDQALAKISSDLKKLADQ